MTKPQSIKPHHLLDIIRDIGSGREHKPHPLGHNVHGIAALVRSDPSASFTLTTGPDSICAPCSRLHGEVCGDTTDTVGFLTSKDWYNRTLDRRLLKRLELREGDSISVTKFCQVVEEKLGDIFSIYLEADRGQTLKRRENIFLGLEILLTAT